MLWWKKRPALACFQTRLTPKGHPAEKEILPENEVNYAKINYFADAANR